MTDSFRLVRLVGDGDASGSGLSLPDAFTAVAQELLDNGPASTAVLTRAVSAACALKEKRVMATWRTWEDFARDIIAQMETAGLVEEAGSRYKLTTGFESGARMVVIPENNIGITVHSRAERQRRNAMTKARLDVRRTAAQLRQDGVDDLLILDAFEALAAMLQTQAIPPDGPSSRRPVPAGRPSRPTADALARSKYGLGGTPTRSTHPFDEHRLRSCGKCGTLRTPEEFPLYWGNQHKGHGDWFLHPNCLECERNRTENRKGKRGGKAEK